VLLVVKSLVDFGMKVVVVTIILCEETAKNKKSLHVKITYHRKVDFILTKKQQEKNNTTESVNIITGNNCDCLRH
jgi:hypothetical protein